MYDSGLAGGHFMSQLENGLDRLCQRRACHLSNATHSLGLLSELHISSHLGKLKILVGQTLPAACVPSTHRLLIPLIRFVLESSHLEKLKNLVEQTFACRRPTEANSNTFLQSQLKNLVEKNGLDTEQPQLTKLINLLQTGEKFQLENWPQGATSNCRPKS